MSDLISTVTALTTGLDSITGSGEQWSIVFAGTWRECDRPNIVISDGTLQYSFGAGDTTGVEPTFVFTFNDKLYALSGATMYFSVIGEPTIFNDENGAGNGYVTMPNYFSAPEDLVAMAHYQGKLAVFSRTTTHIWQVSAKPEDMRQIQLLENLGTFAAKSVQSLGDLDVIFLYDSGVRSLRVRDSSLNAYSMDIGSPVDQLIIDKLAECTTDEREAACSVIDPVSNRYWLFIKDTIFVLSYFPQNKIVAWSQYEPTDETGVAFTPDLMVKYNDRIYIRGTDGNYYLYGGAAGDTYDASKVIVETPWLDDRQPTSGKQVTSLDISSTGKWALSVSTDLEESKMTSLGFVEATTFGRRRIGYNGTGTHFKVKAVTTSSIKAILSSMVIHYNSTTNR